MKTFTVKIQTATGGTIEQVLAFSSSACIAYAFEHYADALGVSAMLN